MVKKKKINKRDPQENKGFYVPYRDYSPELKNESKMHEEIHAIDRRETRRVYHDMEMKRDMEQNFNYARVENPYSRLYAGMDPRRRTEYADGGMVHEDNESMANLSPYGFQRQYPRNGYYANPFIQDSIQGKDEE